MSKATFEGVVRIERTEIPVRLLTAVKDSGTDLCLRCVGHNSPVGMAYICKEGGEQVAGEALGKGYRLPNDTIIPIKNEELMAIPVLNDKTIKITEIHTEGNFPWRMIRGAYLVETLPATQPLFNAFAQALLNNHWVAVGNLVMRGHDHLVAFASNGEGSVDLLQLHWPKSMHPMPESDLTHNPTQSLAIAREMGKMFKNPGRGVSPDAHDRHNEALLALIASKLELKPRRTATKTGSTRELAKAVKL